MRKITFYFFTLLIAVIGLSNVTVSDNGRAGATGAPGEGTCNESGCHGGTSTTGLATLTSNIPATGYVPGATYNMSLTVTMAGKTLFGLGVEALTATNANAGTLVITNSAETQIKSKTISGVSRKNVVHQNNGGLASGTKTFNFNWIAPATGTGNVTFYYAGLACNNNGNDDSGDVCYTGNKVFSPETGTATITATATATTVSCNGGSNGTATVTPTGGSNYTYAWTNGATTATASNLAAGTYTVTVTSGAATTTASATVTQPSALSASTNSPAALSCTTSAVNVSVTASGGTSPYSYLWNNNSTSSSISVSEAGNYAVVITDAHGCTTSASAAVSSNQVVPVAIIAPAQALTCINSTVTLNASGSSVGTDFIYTWSTTEGNIASGGNSLQATVTAGGTYSLLISNTSNGCNASANISVGTDTDLPNIVIAATNQGVITCAQGNVNLSASSTATSVNYAWSGPNGFSATDAQITTNVPGTYQVIVSNNANGCTAQNESTITQNILAATLDQIYNGTGANNASITIDVVGGVAPYTFEWKNASGTIVSTDEDAQGLTNGTYSVNITDANTCVVAISNLLIESSGTVDLAYFSGKLYPNPANNALYFEYDATRSPIAQLQLLNSHGQLVWKATNPSSSSAIDIRAFPTGVYTFRAISASNQSNIRLIIDRK